MTKPDIAPKQQPEIKPLPKLAQIAMRELQKNMNAALMEIVQESATTLGLDVNAWEFDMQRLVFVEKQAKG